MCVINKHTNSLHHKTREGISMMDKIPCGMGLASHWPKAWMMILGPRPRCLWYCQCYGGTEAKYTYRNSGAMKLVNYNFEGQGWLNYLCPYSEMSVSVCQPESLLCSYLSVSVSPCQYVHILYGEHWYQSLFGSLLLENWIIKPRQAL